MSELLAAGAGVLALQKSGFAQTEPAAMAFRGAHQARPLLVLDMYEHSYQLDYGAAAAKYVEAFMLNVNWEEVNRRAEAAGK